MSDQVPALGDGAVGDESTEVEEPEPVDEDADIEEVPALAKWPWWASAIAAAVVLVALGVVFSESWTYIVSSDEEAENEDFEQLLGLLDRVQTVALFVLGAIFGASASVGAASGAASAAKKNAKEARKNHGKAKRNAKSAKKNARVAGLAKGDALALADAMGGVFEQARRGPGPVRMVQLRGEYPVLDLDDTTRPALANIVRGPLADSVTTAYVIPSEDLEAVDDSDHAHHLSEAMELAARIQARYRT